MYAARVEASRDGKPLGAGETHVRAAPGDAEYFDATMHAARLQRIAEETGGRFYTPGTMTALAEDLKYTGRGVTTVEERDLWHMPIVLLLLIGAGLRASGATGGPWGWHRQRLRGVQAFKGDHGDVEVSGGFFAAAVLLAARGRSRPRRRPRRRRTSRVIVGLAGEPEHAELFQRWATTLVDASAQARRRRSRSTSPRSRTSIRSGSPGVRRKDEIVKAFDEAQAAPAKTTSCSSC